MAASFVARSQSSCEAKLARMLVSVGVPDQPWQSFTASGTPSLRGRSLHRLAGLTVRVSPEPSQCDASGPVTPDEMDLRMSAPLTDALKLQRPLPDGALRIVAPGAKEDEPALVA
jgi:hypothetical protein